MNTIFMNSEIIRTSDPNRLLLNHTDKIDLRRKDKYITLSNLCIYYMEKYKKRRIRIIREITEVVLIHCNVVNNSYLQKSKVLYTFVPNKYLGQL